MTNNNKKNSRKKWLMIAFVVIAAFSMIGSSLISIFSY